MLAPLRSGLRKSVTLRTRHRRRDGSEYPVELHLQFMRGDGDPIFVAIALDLTERERAEADRRSLELQLRRAQRLESIGTLASGIAHDFNNILTPIIGHLDLAMPRVMGDEAATRNLERASQAALRARDLVQRILTFSSEMEQERVPVSMHAVVRETLALLRSSLPSTVELRLEASAGEPYVVLGDATQLHQVVLNLCTNAAYAMRERGGALDMGLAFFDEIPALPKPQPVPLRGPWVRLRVRDAGSGMDAATAERVFEPFFTTKSVSEGSGLGLAVVYGIVKTHGGSIAVDTAPGRGTTMDVYLPRVMEGADATGRLPAPIPRGSEHVLFVDDEESIADLAQELLESLGYEVTVCRDAHAALRAVREDPLAFDVVITDETMPGMRGTELSAELLRVRPHLPILLSTGYSEGVTQASVRRLGIQGLLRKPYGKREMAEALAAAIQQG
jgi:signal transduction histidine kinase/CheY-like chemotaxis protein